MKKNWLGEFLDSYLAPIGHLSSSCFSETVELRNQGKVNRTNLKKWRAKTKKAMKEILQIAQEAVSSLEGEIHESQEPK